MNEPNHTLFSVAAADTPLLSAESLAALRPWTGGDRQAGLGESPNGTTLVLPKSRTEVVITVDYEIADFLGAHRIDIDEQMLRPTEALMCICQRHGAKLTLMFEVGAYLLFQQQAPHLARAIEAQLRDAVARGHDVQLHVHPHLLPGADAEYDARRSMLRLRRYRRIHESLANDPHLFVRCKRLCEDLLRPVQPDYEMVAYRACKYQVQPHAAVYEALAKAGFLAASNVVPGLFLRSYGGALGHDYRASWTDCEPYFPSQANLCWPAIPCEQSLLEFPVCASDAMGWSFDVLDGEQLARMFEAHKDKRVPLVMLGHSKGPEGRKKRPFQNLDEVLSRISSDPDAAFSTLAEAARRWHEIARHRRPPARWAAIESHCVSVADAAQRRLRVDRRALDKAVKRVAGAAARNATCNVAVFGCGAGYALLLPLAHAYRNDSRLSFWGGDCDPLALDLAQHVAERWRLANVRFGGAPPTPVDLAIVPDLYNSARIRQADLRMAQRVLRPDGSLMTFQPSRGLGRRLFDRLRGFGFAMSVRFPSLARPTVWLVRMLHKMRSRCVSTTADRRVPRQLLTPEVAAALADLDLSPLERKP